MKCYSVKELTEADAKEIFSWKYTGDIAIYNFPDYNIAEKSNWALTIKDKREAQFVGIWQGNELIAYGRITNNINKVVIGIGLKPLWCGKGYGKDIMKLLIAECKKKFPNYPITLEVRTFNARAIKCYKNVGFVIKDTYIKDTFNGEDEYYYMEYSHN